MQEVPLRPRRERVERPAGRQHQLMAARERIDPGGIETHDRGFVRAVAEFSAVASRHVDLVADDDALEEGEVRIAVCGIDGDAAFAGTGRAFDVPWTEGERLAAAASEHDGAGMDPLYLDACDR